MQVKPSLLHGDLWSGNMSPVEGGEWSILDPAVYYVSDLLKIFNGISVFPAI